MDAYCRPDEGREDSLRHEAEWPDLTRRGDAGRDCVPRSARHGNSESSEPEGTTPRTRRCTWGEIHRGGHAPRQEFIGIQDTPRPGQPSELFGEQMRQVRGAH